MPVSKHWYMHDARTRTGSNISKPFFPKGFFTLPCREWFSVHPPYGVWEGTSHPIYWKKLYVLDCPQAQHRPCSGLAMALRAFPSFACYEAFWLLQDFSFRIKVFHGLERPPKTRLEKNSQRHGPGTLSVRVFEPQYWSEGVWQKTFPALKSFVCYKPWRAVLEAPDGHETNFWQPEKFILVDLESIYFHYTAASFYTNLTQPPAWIIKINCPALQKFYSMGPCHLHVRKLPVLLNSQ